MTFCLWRCFCICLMFGQVLSPSDTIGWETSTLLVDFWNPTRRGHSSSTLLQGILSSPKGSPSWNSSSRYSHFHHIPFKLSNLQVGRDGALQLVSEEMSNRYSWLAESFPRQMEERGFPRNEKNGLKGFYYRWDRDTWDVCHHLGFRFRYYNTYPA